MTYFLSSAQIFYLEYFLHRYFYYGIYKEPLLYCKASVLNQTRYLPKFDSTPLVSLSKINGLTDSVSEGTAHMLRLRPSQSRPSSSAVITASVIYCYVLPFLLVLTSRPIKTKTSLSTGFNIKCMYNRRILLNFSFILSF